MLLGRLLMEFWMKLDNVDLIFYNESVIIKLRGQYN